MSKAFLYKEIIEAVREQIRKEIYQPGQRLPSVRDMAGQWSCTIGTVQRAYRELAQQGLVVTRLGQGTRVVGAVSAEEATPLRRANLVHRAEAFLLEVLTAGYSEAEVEQAMQLALDRWRTLRREPSHPSKHLLRFVGSHDPAMAMIATHFSDVAPDCVPQVTFAGSLGGLMALAAGEADVAGCHLWDEESHTYNVPFVKHLLLGQRVALLTLAHRQLGLMLTPALSMPVSSLADLSRLHLRFVNRQRGAGTRVWFDVQLHQLGLDPEQISGYEREAQTHSEVAQAIAEGEADAGLGVEAAALAYGLQFVPLTTERYDLVIPVEVWDLPSVQGLVQWLSTAEAKQTILALGGYDLTETGHVAWVE